MDVSFALYPTCGLHFTLVILFTTVITKEKMCIHKAEDSVLGASS